MRRRTRTPRALKHLVSLASIEELCQFAGSRASFQSKKCGELAVDQLAVEIEIWAADDHLPRSRTTIQSMGLAFPLRILGRFD
jgi:hypothetical protein